MFEEISEKIAVYKNECENYSEHPFLLLLFSVKNQEKLKVLKRRFYHPDGSMERKTGQNIDGTFWLSLKIQTSLVEDEIRSTLKAFSMIGSNNYGILESWKIE